MAYFSSSVALDATADEAFGFMNSPEHLRAFVTMVEPDETFANPDGAASGGGWFHAGAVHRHRIDWHGTHSHGSVWVIHRGDGCDLVAQVHTGTDKAGLEARVDAALFHVQELIQALQAVPAGVPRPEDSASFVVETVLKGLRRHLPVQLRGQLTPYLQAAVTLDGSVEVEAKRGAVCRAWADALAVEDRHGLGRRVIGFIEHVHHAATSADETLVGAEGVTARDTEAEAEHHGRRLVDPAAISAIDPGAVPAGFKRDVDESYEAVSEAAEVAAHRGWDTVPWKPLLDSLLSA
jgi:hypothetical protein